ncbi:MAG: NAD-dependent succinate-semialdehyde dehydrogenase [Bacillota bacterium]|jgi:succinate-semialdehyde dehydrogenase/glutarate-semialdehyde dehydrogenase|nr:NAD-dependent succinate-semialdehyde dehydrogenase [Bacillota bacterium]HOB89518.1 NAD-dependent succinate-semialdehyde dehydrogenase [Bacillota bacterium]HOJ58286.1 NAD-dependent succinate-semialdehyde dehydrogenase [Bacillota bacterium]HOL02551.1 NAD-dependent succinate-semialdehyde dehydrogenase [Bacillota bacterium]HPO81007.1 NAD-dependent succinate-semialdehyde dehydrogenase [Bacillota bacterium]
MMIREKMLIGGNWVDAGDREVLEVVNPATEEVFAVCPKATRDDVEAAINAANEAFPSWSNLTPFKRGEYLRKASEIVRSRSRDIAEMMTMEQGKPLKEAEGEVIKGADILRYYAEEGERVYGRIIPNAEANTESRVIYQPIGVAAAISPWNYPIELLAWKVGGALASGCTIVAKLPSETPLSPLAFIRCLVDAGVPAGVVNALVGSGAVIGPMLLESPIVKKVAFTGSTAVGKDVLKNSADTLKRTSMELGGSLPMVVCKDCDMEAAVAGAVRRSFRNMGQICIAINRIYVDEAVYEEFLERFREAAEKLTIGNGLTKECDLGPMCTRSGVEKAIEHIEDAVKKGAKVVCGGKRPEGEEYRKGYFFEPTILRDVNHSMLVMTEETFGPVVGVMPFKDIDEAIALANDSVYGLAAIVYTNSLSLAERLAREIDAGNVAINNVDAGVINAPYGGWKDSGFGHEHGPEGLYEYLNIKHVRVRYL